MADIVKFGMLRKLLRALGFSEAAVKDLFDWITDRLADEQQTSAECMVQEPYCFTTVAFILSKCPPIVANAHFVRELIQM